MHLGTVDEAATYVEVAAKSEDQARSGEDTQRRLRRWVQS